MSLRGAGNATKQISLVPLTKGVEGIRDCFAPFSRSQ